MSVDDMTIFDLEDYIVAHSYVTFEELDGWTTEELEEFARNLGYGVD